MHRLAVRDDHVLEGKLKQRAQRRQRPLFVRRVAQTRNSPAGAVSASANTMARCSSMKQGDSQNRLKPWPASSEAGHRCYSEGCYSEHCAASTFPDSTFSFGALAADAAPGTSLDAELWLGVELF